VEHIALSAFRSGRYHADARFPRGLADVRYMHWIARALSGENPADRVYVAHRLGAVSGFFHVALRGETADLRLAALEPGVQGGTLGFSMYLDVLNMLKSVGVRRATAKLSAGNTAVLNLYSALGFHFSSPEMTLHWHAQGAPHLVDTNATVSNVQGLAEPLK
jgi:hypothetical protein